ncbi:MAG: type II secretion system protein GspD [Thermoanaerobaculia bacterium]
MNHDTGAPARGTRLLALALLALLSGCRSDASREPPSVEQLLELYKHRLTAIATEERAPDSGRIVTLDVSSEGTVDLDVRNAPLMTVLRRLLDASGRPYRISGSPVEIRITESFRGVPLEQACNQLLAGRGGQCLLSSGILVAELQSASVFEDGTPPDAIVLRVPLRHLSAARAAEILGGLYSTTGFEEPDVHFGVDAATNTVALTGPPDAVGRTARYLAQADVGPEHVMIEANVFAVQTSELQRLGARLSGSGGEFSNITLNLGSLLAGGISFTRVAGADNVTAFTAMIDVLLATEAAKVIARPFIGVVSGERATISVTNDRQVAVLSEGGFAPVTTTVSSGVQLEFGAVVRPGGTIRLDVAVEESTFVPTVEGAVSEIARSNATTIMEVPSGQSVVIGGISFHRSNDSRVGVPGLRDIPVVGKLFGSRGESRKDAQLIVVVTPRVWEPGMEHPPPLGDVSGATD